MGTSSAAIDRLRVRVATWGGVALSRASTVNEVVPGTRGVPRRITVGYDETFGGALPQGPLDFAGPPFGGELGAVISTNERRGERRGADGEPHRDPRASIVGDDVPHGVLDDGRRVTPDLTTVRSEQRVLRSVCPDRGARRARHHLLGTPASSHRDADFRGRGRQGG